MSCSSDLLLMGCCAGHQLVRKIRSRDIECLYLQAALGVQALGSRALQQPWHLLSLLAELILQVGDNC